MVCSVGVRETRVVVDHAEAGGADLEAVAAVARVTAVESSPGVVQTVHSLEDPLIFTVGPAPVGERLHVPSTLAATCLLTTLPSTYQRVPSPRKWLVS